MAEFGLYLTEATAKYINGKDVDAAGNDEGVFNYSGLGVPDDTATRDYDETRLFYLADMDMTSSHYLEFATTICEKYKAKQAGSSRLYGNTDLFNFITQACADTASQKPANLLYRFAVHSGQVEALQEIFGAALTQDKSIVRDDGMQIWDLEFVDYNDMGSVARHNVMTFAGLVEADYASKISNPFDLETAIGLDLANFYYTVAAPAVDEGIAWLGGAGLNQARTGATLNDVLGCSAKADTAVDVMVGRFWQATRLWTSEEDLNNLALDLKDLATELAPAERMQAAYYQVVLEVFGQKVKSQCSWYDNSWHDLTPEMTGTEVVQKILDDEADSRDERLEFQEIWLGAIPAGVSAAPEEEVAEVQPAPAAPIPAAEPAPAPAEESAEETSTIRRMLVAPIDGHVLPCVEPFLEATQGQVGTDELGVAQVFRNLHALVPKFAGEFGLEPEQITDRVEKALWSYIKKVFNRKVIDMSGSGKGVEDLINSEFGWASQPEKRMALDLWDCSRPSDIPKTPVDGSSIE